jgi:CheY-like chemotaxis protein
MTIGNLPIMIARNSIAPRLLDSNVWDVQSQQPVASRSPRKQHSVELKTYYAYNQTRGHLLGSQVDFGDFSVAIFNDRIPTLAANSGAGIWLVPFRGISLLNEQTPLDLICLDANLVVIDLVESFPISRMSKGSPPAASVLVLPGHTIGSTQTRRGDQLLLSGSEEFDRRLLQLTGASGNARTTQSANSSKPPEISSGSGSRLQAGDCSGQERPHKDAPSVLPPSSWQSRQDVLNDPKGEKVTPTKNWFQRLWFPDPPEPRKAPRESFPGLSAHFWTGGAPVDHGVRDISLTGLYVLTEERWFLGTQVRMTLKDSRESTVVNSITAYTSVVRWGNDGVGLKFVMEDEKALCQGRTPLVSGTNRKQLDRFWHMARKGKRENETRDIESLTHIAQGDAPQNTDELFIGPVNSSLLIDRLKNLPRPVGVAGDSPWLNLPNTAPLRLPGVASAAPSERRPRILLIDDEYLDITFLAGTLEEDYQVIFATDGVSALESASRNMPDLILLDVLMPGIDGFEVCRRLKADNRTKDIPVIFITGLSAAAAETRGLNVGAVEYIRKPFHAAALKVKVKMQINLKMAQDN